MGGKDKGEPINEKRHSFESRVTVNFSFSGLATEIKPDVGKGKKYQVPEYFKYNQYSYFDVEKDMVKDRVPQPKSGLTDFW